MTIGTNYSTEFETSIMIKIDSLKLKTIHRKGKSEPYCLH